MAFSHWALHAFLAVSILMPGCTPGCRRRVLREDAAEKADHEVSQIFAQRRDAVPGAPATVGIERLGQDELDRFTPPQPKEPAGLPVPEEETEAAEKGNGLPPVEGAHRLTLREALELAARHSREYQTRKEDLYLVVLALTRERFRWDPQWTGDLNAGAARTPNSKWAELGSAFTFSRLLNLGGRLTASLATDLVRFSAGDPRTTATSLLGFEFLQPLWRNYGSLVAKEGLTQAERDVVYALRSFAHYRKSFCVDVTSRYYRVLQQRDTVMNQWSNYKRIRQSRADREAERLEGLVEALQVDQIRQDELRARASWVRALRQYREQIDQFKVFLGLPADALVELDAVEGDRLREAGLREITLSPDAASAIALERRLDLLTATDRIGDAERAVEIARNGLAPDVDLKLSTSIPSDPPTNALKLEPHRGTYSAGVTVGLPLQRLEERNAYRSALIGLDRARRSADDLREQIKLEVREASRTLQETSTTYRIERDSVALAQRREQAARELFRIGEAIARDLLDANEALVNAQNALTRALVDHILARLALWRDTELLRVDEHGVWQEVTDVNQQ